MLYRIFRCYVDDNYDVERRELCGATTDKAKAENFVVRMNAIANYNDGDTFEIEEGEEEQDFDFVSKAEQCAIEKAKRDIELNVRYVEDAQREIAAITTIKELFVGATKAPMDMVPEMIVAIQGTDCGLFVCEYFNAHKLIIHYPNGEQDVRIGENYANGSYLGINDSRFHYSNQWDFDEDLEHVEMDIAEAKENIAEAKAFLAKMSAN